MDKKTTRTDEEWQALLGPEQYHICRQKGTERPFTGKYYHHDEEGIYTCACCGSELFAAEHKYESGSGWPSFWQAIDEGRINRHVDQSHGMTRIEITCAACDGHLGHLFDDGPAPTGQRYCVNSASLDFKAH